VIGFLLAVGVEAWSILREASVFLFLGFGIAALLAVLAPRNLLQFFRRGKIRSVLWASAIGTPLPLCSCGVVPTAVALSKQGATRGAVVSFLVSTPEIGLDSMALSYALLDPILTIARPVAAFITAAVAGIATNFLAGDAPSPAGETSSAEANAGERGAAADSIARSIGLPGAGARGRTRACLDAFRELLDETSHWLVLGIALAAVVAVALPAGLIERYLSGGLLTMLAMLALGIPLYTCASASTPIAAALILKGLSPGAALVFLLSGPATNIASIVVLLTVLGRRVVSIYLAAIAGVSVVTGLAVDALYQRWGLSAAATIGQAVEFVPEALKTTAALAFIAVLGLSLSRTAVPREWIWVRDRVAELTGVRFTVRGTAMGVLVFAVALYAGSGFFTVGPGEVAVTTRLGVITGDRLGPGLHYRWPWPVEDHRLVQLDRVRRLEIGFRTPGSATADQRPLPRPGPVSAAPAIAPTSFWSGRQKLANESLVLMGDQNIIDIAFSVQYRVTDAVRYLYRVADPEEVLRSVSISVLRSVLATMDVDAVYTTARADVEATVARGAQVVLDRYDSGIRILGVNLLSVHPPEDVHAAFRDLASAHEDKILVIERATTFAREAVTLAEGDAAAMIESAHAYKDQKILEAEGDAVAFTLRDKEYRRAPDLTRFRLHLEALEEILPAAHKILRPGKGNLKDFDLWLVQPPGPRKNP